MNKVFIKGRLTRNPEIKYINEEKSVTKFSLAINRKFTKKDEEQQTDFINVVAWNKIGEFISKYFEKGQEIAIIGRLETSQYVDKESQKKLTNYSVIVEEVEFCGNKTERKENDDVFSPDNNEIVNINFDDDDELPF